MPFTCVLASVNFKGTLYAFNMKKGKQKKFLFFVLLKKPSPSVKPTMCFLPIYI